MKTLAICAPVFNEENGILEFLNSVDESLSVVEQQLEISFILVDDGSSDQSVEMALKWSPSRIKHLHILKLSRNFGHASAVTALFHEASAYDAMILLDADMQDRPELLPKLISEWRSGFQSVRVVRGKRFEGFIFAVLSKIFYNVFGKVSGLRSGVGNFGLYDRKVVAAILTYPERVRYVPGIITLTGFRTSYVEVDRSARLHGESRVGYRGLIRLAMTAIFSFSTLPIQLMAAAGFAFSFVAAIGGVMIICLKLFSDLAIPGWASLLTAQFFFGGLTVFCLGIIGNYVGIIFEEVKARPIYIAAERISKSFPDANH